MKIIKTIGKSLGVSFLSIALAFAIITLGIVKITEYNSLKPLIDETIKMQFAELDENKLIDIHTSYLNECENSEKIQLPVELENVQNITIDCKDIESSSPKDLPVIISTSVFESIYYYEYDCSFILCLQKENIDKPLLFLSKNMNTFFRNVEIFLWVASVISIILIIITVDTLEKKLRVIGICLIVLGLPMIIFILFKDSLMGYFMPSTPVEFKDLVSPIINRFFNITLIGFIVVTLFGIGLVISAYSLKFIESKKK